MINSLKRLSGAERVVQDDFNKGIGIFRVICKAPPAVKTGDVKKVLGRYKLDKVEFKVTGRISKKRDKYYISRWLLENPTGENAPDNLAKVAELQKARKIVILWGLVKEDARGKQTLAVSKVSQYKK